MVDTGEGQFGILCVLSGGDGTYELRRLENVLKTLDEDHTQERDLGQFWEGFLGGCKKGNRGYGPAMSFFLRTRLVFEFLKFCTKSGGGRKSDWGGRRGVYVRVRENLRDGKFGGASNAR